MTARSRGRRDSVLLLGLLLAAGAARADLPQPVLDHALDAVRMCKEAGGSPSVQGASIPGAGQADEVFIPFVTEADLNGDGAADYVTDLAGFDCVDAWTLFCGSAGCPVTVWLSEPAGHAVAWGGHAQAWELRETEVILYLHGQMCTPPRTGPEGCEETLRFDGAAAPAGASEPAPPGALASSPRPRPRPGAEAPAPAAATAAVEAPAAVPAEAPEPVATAPAPAPAPVPAAPWMSRERQDIPGWYAEIQDPASGARLVWLCAKGTESRLAMTPHPGGETLTIDVDGRVQHFAVEVEGETAYAPVAIGAPIFLHIASGRAFSVLDPAGAPVARFTMDGAPLAIGQTEGRCQF